MAGNHAPSEDRWVDFAAFCREDGQPQLNVRFALQALHYAPRRKPEDRRFTVYNLTWIDDVHTFLDQLGNQAYQSM